MQIVPDLDVRICSIVSNIRLLFFFGGGNMQRAGVHIKCTEPVRETCFSGELGSQSQAVHWVIRIARMLRS